MMLDLFFAEDVMKYPSGRPTHIVRGEAGKVGVLPFGGDQFVGGVYLCGVKGMITVVGDRVVDWLAVENLVDSGVSEHYCNDCLKQASFLLGADG